MERCPDYVGLACVDGSCPMITRDEYGDYRRPIVESCEECYLYKGCEDCAFEDTEHCDRRYKHGTEEQHPIRFSDELAALIDRQIGDTFTQKFENLITRCVWELPQKEEELRRVQEQIKQERQRLTEIQKASKQISSLMWHLKNAQDYIKNVEVLAKTITEAAEIDKV